MQIANQKSKRIIDLTAEIWKNEDHEDNGHFGGIRNFGERTFRIKDDDVTIKISEEEWRKLEEEKRRIIEETIDILLEGRKTKFNKIIQGLAENRKAEYIRQERESLKISRSRTNQYSYFDLYDVPRSYWGIVSLRFHPYIIYKSEIAFDKYLDELESKQENIFFIELIDCCRCLQSNKTYYDKDENTRNRFIRDLLKAKGFNVQDQTQHGQSSTGKSAGEVDLLVENPIYTIIEALNLNSVDSTILNSHIKKLEENYDPEGLTEKYLLVYADKQSKFNDFCTKYHGHIDKHEFEFEKTGIERLPTVTTNIRVYQTVHLREGVKVKLFHILVKMPVKS